ncbi:FHA domain-containing protein [Allocoleopsis sp.]|uniref:FHA domain-containing protein n=1 Tax=Allocoleopsis sp. TaxID=3088169 RepID=UPI002FD39329
MIKFIIIDDQTGESQEEKLTPETLIQGGGLIGRHPSCDIVLNSPEVSRVHGRILYREGQYYFTDLGSTGGSHVNKQEASTNENFLLKPNDIIRIGGFILLVKEVPMDGNSAMHKPQKVPVLPLESCQIEQLIFKVEELKSQGLLNPSTSEFVVQGKRLAEGLSFSQRFRQKALELCQAELDAGKFCVLVEHSDHVTIWQEEQLDEPENVAQNIPTGQAQNRKK